MIYSMMTRTPVEILVDFGKQKVDWSDTEPQLLLAKFNWKDGDAPEDRYIFAHNLVADNGWTETRAIIKNAPKNEVALEKEVLEAALYQAR